MDLSDVLKYTNGSSFNKSKSIVTCMCYVTDVTVFKASPARGKIESHEHAGL